jgi:transitional endoplasmic reticulum ATPase
MTEGRRLAVGTASEGPRKVAWLAGTTMAGMALSTGDAVAVDGSRRTVARVAPKEEVPTDEVWLDEGTREDAGVDVGDPVTVAGVDAPPAARVTFAPGQSLKIRGGSEALRDALEDAPVTREDRVRLSLFGGALELSFVVVDTDPPGPVRVRESTDVQVRAETADLTRGRPRLRNVTFEDVGGLGRERSALADVERLAAGDDVFERLGRRPATGVLLSGPPGVGKTHLVHALVNETGATFLPVDGPRLAESSADDAATRVEDLLSRARENPPAIVFIEDLDELAPAGEAGGDRTRRLVARLRRFVDDLADVPGAVALAEARSVGDVDRTLRRGGRFDRHVEFHSPSRSDRRELLEIHARGLALAPDVDLDELADRSHGYVGADVGTLCRAAAAAAARRLEGDGPDAEGTATVTMADFRTALESVEATGMRDVTVEVPRTTYDDVGGLEDAKRELVRSVEWPLRHPGLFDRLGVTPPRGILLYGPPGTGKTLLARAVANATDANFISVKGPELLNKYVGESERAVRDIFERARQNAPAVIFFDEIDAISAERGDEDSGAPERVVSQLLTEIDGVERIEGVTVVGATNRPDRIDPALLRPGRFERIVAVPVPDESARRAVFRVHTRSMPLAPDVDLDALAARTEGYTGSDVEAVVREAGMLAVEDALGGGTDPEAVDVAVTMAHLERALADTQPSTTPDQREYYERMRDREFR